jgi:hypothetical protein
MQVFGLPAHVIRNGGAASRLIAAKTPNIAAAIRGDAVARWWSAMAKGLSAEDAAEARPSAFHPLSLTSAWTPTRRQNELRTRMACFFAPKAPPPGLSIDWRCPTAESPATSASCCSIARQD